MHRKAFTAALIGPITAKIQTVEGGDGIVRSTFEARTAVYDGFGNFDNMGRIGAITVTNAADQLASGAGIRESKFFAGAAGGIGDLTVTTASGSGVAATTAGDAEAGRDFEPAVAVAGRDAALPSVGAATACAGA
jgi:hypothetical protein